ncbi:MAG: YlbF family regulator [Eubacteriales bacterium]|nr:YlbF family regulator [Eubacteriales bacterium]
MFVYDKAHELAKEIKSSEDYKEYARLKEIVMADEKTKALLGDYKKLQLEAQAGYLTGKEPAEETMDKLKKLGEVLAFNNDVTAFFAAEYKFQTMIGDVYKIIGDACDMGLDFFNE